jgi:hypothetical protein
MIKQLRGFHSPEYLSQMYAKPHNHFIFGRGHHIRVELTKVLYKEMCGRVNAKTGADLSCGNAEIIKSFPLDTTHLGDFAEGYHFKGPLHQTLEEIPQVDIYVCSETLEHVEKPLETLTQIRGRSKSLVLTTPIENWNDTLDEHYWSWDREGVEELIIKAGWKIVNFVVFDSTVFGEPYKYGMWCCE